MVAVAPVWKPLPRIAKVVPPDGHAKCSQPILRGGAPELEVSAVTALDNAMAGREPILRHDGVRDD
jgi:hypothetical protein